MPKPLPQFCMTEYGRKLAEPYYGWAYKVTFPWRDKHPHLAEAFDGAVSWGLVHAAVAFDPSRGAKFVTLLATCVDRRCGAAVLASKRMKRRYDHPLPLLDEIALPAGPGPDPDDGELLPLLLDALPTRSAEFVRRHVVEGETMKSIAESCGLSKQTVSNVVARSLEWLRSHPALEGLDS